MSNWPENWSRTARAVDDGMAAGLHIGAQIVVRRDGDVVCNAAVGLARIDDSPQAENDVLPSGPAMTPDSLVPWLSSGKPITAAAIMQLVEQGQMRLDEPTSRYIPEFGDNGKQAVSVEHLLTHTCGFRFVDWGDAETPWPEIVRRLCVTPLEKNWIPGQRAGYHPYTSWFILAELVEKVSGESFSDYVRRHIFLPLAMDDCWFGIPHAAQQTYGDSLAVLPNTERRGAEARPSRAPHPWSTGAGRAACIPGGNGHGPLIQLARFYEMLLGDGTLEGTRLLAPASVRQMIARRRVGMYDETFRHTLDWGLGTIPNNRRYGVDTAPYGYGLHASESAFGHSGSQSSAVFADTVHRLVVGVFLNGACGEARHQIRIRGILNSLYEDLGITRDDE